MQFTRAELEAALGNNWKAREGQVNEIWFQRPANDGRFLSIKDTFIYKQVKLIPGREDVLNIGDRLGEIVGSLSITDHEEKTISLEQFLTFVRPMLAELTSRFAKSYRDATTEEIEAR